MPVYMLALLLLRGNSTRYFVPAMPTRRLATRCTCSLVLSTSSGHTNVAVSAPVGMEGGCNAASGVVCCDVLLLSQQQTELMDMPSSHPQPRQKGR